MEFLEKIQYALATLAGFGLFLVPIAMVAYSLRHELKALYERYLRQSCLARAVIASCFCAAVYAGAVKPLIDSMDSDYAHEDYGHELMGMCCLSFAAPRMITTSSLVPSPESLVPDMTTIPNWTTRGAFEDWQTIDLPDGFAFPVGLTNLTRVTIMAYGEIRESLKGGGGAHGVSALPFPVSCQPGETTVSYGLTASNTFVVAWSNALSNRVAFTAAATNRLNAAIELFPSGAIATTITSDYPSEVPSTYSLVPAPLPSGFYGSGQDEAWIRGNFALFQSLDASLTNAEQILDAGYATWLDDWVGVNEQNGHVKATLTIAAMPDNGAPCYLVCGPYKVVIPAAGSYALPIEVFTDYPARTYPEAVPITVAYDEGYTLDGTTSTTGEATSSSLQSETNPIVRNDPEFHITPSVIYVDETTTTNEPYVVSVWINAANFMQKTWRVSSEQIRLCYTFPSQMEVYTANINAWVEFTLERQGHTVTGELQIMHIEPDQQLCEFCDFTNCPCDMFCYPGCPCHPDGTNVCVRVEQ